LFISPGQLEEKGIHWDRVSDGDVRLRGRNGAFTLVAKPERSSRLLIVQGTIQHSASSTFATSDGQSGQEEDNALQWHRRMALLANFIDHLSRRSVVVLLLHLSLASRWISNVLYLLALAV
jgi:hypothetical protein